MMDRTTNALKTARRLIAADIRAGPCTTGGTDQLSRSIFVARPGSGEPQDRCIVRLHFHAPAMDAFRKNAVDTPQIVARHVEQQVMLKVIVHVIRRDEQALQE